MARKNEQTPEPQARKTAPGAKGAPTRTRKEAEAANRRPLVPNDRKLARSIEREKRNEAIAREREALLTGDERYLPPRDKGVIRRYIRNWVDARWSISEFLLPVMLLFLVGVMAVSFLNLTSRWTNLIMVILMITFYALMFISIVEATIVWFRMKRRLRVLYPDQPIPRGSWFYLYTRMLMARRWRSPKPQVARGEFPEGKKTKKQA